MNEMMVSITAAADIPMGEGSAGSLRRARMAEKEMERLRAHSFPGRCGQIEESPTPKTEKQRTKASATPREATGGTETLRAELDRRYRDWYELERQRRIYRGRTVGMLRRYMRYSMDMGRLPSLVGREFFRSKMSKYKLHTFEDRVIFVHDMETCLHRLDEFSQAVVGRVVLQEYGQEEAAQLLGCTRITVHRVLMEALDELSQILVRVGLLAELFPNSEKACQEGKNGCFDVSCCEDGE